jgi:hypothetical protein
MKQKSLTVSTEICRMGKRFNYAYALSNTGWLNGLKPGDGKGKMQEV